MLHVKVALVSEDSWEILPNVNLKVNLKCFVYCLIRLNALKLRKLRGFDGFESPRGTENIVAAGFNPPKKYNV
jgi:hypothetical protein